MKQLLGLFALLATLYSYSQKTLSKDYQYNVSEPYPVVEGDQKFYFSRDDSKQVIALKFDKPEIYIQRFDPDKPAFISEKKYKDFLPDRHDIESVRILGDKMYLFYSSWDKANEIEQLFAQEIDFEKGEFVGSAKLLFKVQGRVSRAGRAGDASETADWSKFDIQPSFDRKLFMVQYRKRPEVKRDTKSYDIIGLYTFDNNLNKLSDKEYKMPYTERKMDNLDYQIDNKGNLYLLAKIYHDDTTDEKKNKKDTLANYHVELLTMKKGETDIKITKVETGSNFINKLWIFASPANELIAAGYYNNGKGKSRRKAGVFTFFGNSSYTKDGNCDGVMMFKMNTDGSVSDLKTFDIPLDLINQYESKRTQKKNVKKEEKGEGAKFTDLALKNLQYQKDGSIIMVGEQDFIIVNNTSTGGSFGMAGMNTHVSYDYHYEDILVTKINPDGTLGWMSKVPKRQIGHDVRNPQGGMSYKFFSNETNHFLVFLDNVKNIDLSLDKDPAIHSDGKGGYLTSVKMSDADGSYEKGSILNSRDVEDFKLRQFSTNRVVKTGETSFVVEAYKKSKEDIMIKIVLK